uniref:Uncharacterized protein n=1 Tax=viral metagenome TaxID=1070528 RepID=A0A6M3L5I1_9ZZZZ
MRLGLGSPGKGGAIGQGLTSWGEAIKQRAAETTYRNLDMDIAQRMSEATGPDYVTNEMILEFKQKYPNASNEEIFKRAMQAAALRLKTRTNALFKSYIDFLTDPEEMPKGPQAFGPKDLARWAKKEGIGADELNAFAEAMQNADKLGAIPKMNAPDIFTLGPDQKAFAKQGGVVSEQPVAEGIVTPEKPSPYGPEAKAFEEHKAGVESDKTADIKNYERAVEQGYKGDFNTWLIDVKRAGATNIGIGYKMPADEVGKIGEFKAYIETMDKINGIVTGLESKGENVTGPIEGGFIGRVIDDWGLMPNKVRIELRTFVARLPGLMYAMRGKQLSDKELEVALEMMPKMAQSPVAFKIALKNFNDYMNLILQGKQKAFGGAGYDIGAFGGKPGGGKTLDEAADELIKKWENK